MESFLIFFECSEPLFSESFYPPEFSEGSPRVPVEGAVKQARNPIYSYNVSRIMISSLRGQPLRQEPSESPWRAPGEKRGFRGSPPSVKRTYDCNCRDLPSFPLLGSPRPQHILYEYLYSLDTSQHLRFKTSLLQKICIEHRSQQHCQPAKLVHRVGYERCF